MPQRCDFEVLSTRPWSDFGIANPEALHQQEAFVRDDGGSWKTHSIFRRTSTSTVVDVTATSNGFVMAEQGSDLDGLGSPRIGSALVVLRRTSWSPMAGRCPRIRRGVDLR